MTYKRIGHTLQIHFKVNCWIGLHASTLYLELPEGFFIFIKIQDYGSYTEIWKSVIFY